MRVSALILTYNEARNLPRCLAALDWCDDVVVLDSGSTDGTASIAEKANARVLVRAFDNFAAQRNYGIEFSAFKHDWVLHLDADEVVTPEFRAAVAQCEPPPNIDGYLVPSKLMLFGKWLRHSGMYPVFQVRLGRRDALRFTQVGHGQRETLDRQRLAIFPEPYLHFSFSHGLAAWFSRHVRYAKEEAELLADVPAPQWSAVFTRDALARRRALKQVSSRVPVLLRPLARFIYVYVVRGGFLDGSAGLTYSVMLATYEAMTSVIGQELRSGPAGRHSR